MRKPSLLVQGTGASEMPEGSLWRSGKREINPSWAEKQTKEAKNGIITDIKRGMDTLTHDKKALVQLSLHGASQIPKNRIKPSCWRRCLMRCHKPIAVKTQFVILVRSKQTNSPTVSMAGELSQRKSKRLHVRSPLSTCAGMNWLHRTKCLRPRAATTTNLHSRYVLSMRWEAFWRGAPRALARQR